MPNTPKLNGALVNAFNLHNFGSNVDTNFFAEGSNIVVKFGGDELSGHKYLEFMGEEVRKEHFTSEKDSGLIYNLNSFPFKLDGGKWQRDEDNGKKGITKFVVPASQATVANLQYHFTIERVGVITGQMIRELVHYGYDEKEAQDYVKKSIKYNKIRKSLFRNTHLHLSFSDKGFMDNFIQKYKTDMEWSNDDFLKRWSVNGLSMSEKTIYDKSIMLRDIGLVVDKTKELIGLFFDVSGSENQLVKRYKNAMSDLILRKTDIPISGYYRDLFVDQSTIDDGGYFAFIPEVIDESVGKRYLNREEVDKVNGAFGFALLRNVEGQTKGTESCKNGGIYALTNKQIASLIPGIIRESSITEIDGNYGLAIDYDITRSRSSSKETSAVTSPAHESKPGPSGGSQEQPSKSTSPTNEDVYDESTPPSTPPAQTGSSFFDSRPGGDEGYHSNSSTPPKKEVQEHPNPTSKVGSLTAKQHLPNKEAVKIY